MTDYLSSDELNLIRSEVKSVIEDSQMSMTVIYRRLVGQVFNPSTGTTTPAWNEVTITGFRTEFTLRDITLSGGIIKVGDHMFLFDPAILGAVPKADDRVLETVTSAGEVALTNLSATVQGIGVTRFVLDGVQGGDILRIGSVDRVVKSITDDDTLVLSANYTGTSILATDYVIYRSHEIVQHTRAALNSLIRLQLRRAGG